MKMCLASRSLNLIRSRSLSMSSLVGGKSNVNGEKVGMAGII